MAAWLLLGAWAHVGAPSLAFVEETYHVSISQIGAMPLRTVHILNGSTPAAGGTITAFCLNGTVDPYTISFGQYNESERSRPFTATLFPTKGGDAVSLSGYAMRCGSICMDLVFFPGLQQQTLLTRGRIPPGCKGVKQGIETQEDDPCAGHRCDTDPCP
jgi:hypothetical protein